MKIRSVEFVGGLARPGGSVPGGLPEVAFGGRSNVGKSSLINTILGRTRTPIARVSKSPGKTREVNFFRVDATGFESGEEIEFFLVDLPGYGYAKVPDAVRDAWKPLIETYLRRSPALQGVVQLIDARHGPTKADHQMLTFLADLGTPTLVALTKVDKLKRSQRKKQLGSIAKELELEMEQIVPFSSVTGEGRDELLRALEGLLEDVVP
ncbi:MAG: ribosome biogenesis GTP-binding protein YihA/YsxC [Longimicrobiales bacterium]|nr:ribosome biogenesis GTP-binding protein YihA/YsxC [Longimicrobiales bacterium]